MAILLVTISGYFIISYWWLLVDIFGHLKLYYHYRWLFYYKLLLNILGYITIRYW